MTMTCFMFGTSASSIKGILHSVYSHQITTPAGRSDPRVFGVKYTAVGPESNSRLQFDRFNFSDESLVVVGEERTDHVEHGVTEASDVQNVRSFASLNRLVRLQVDVD